MCKHNSAKEARPKGLTLAELAKTVRGHDKSKDFDVILSDLKRWLQRDATIGEACRQAKISVDTYYAWIKKSETFETEMALAQDFPFTTAKNNIIEKIAQEKDTELSKWLLERRRKANYAQRQELTGSEGEAVNFGIKDLLDGKVGKK